MSGGAWVAIVLLLVSSCGRIDYEGRGQGDAGSARDGAMRDASAVDARVTDANGDDVAFADAGRPCEPGVRVVGPVTSCPFACHNPDIAWTGEGYVLCFEQEESADIASSSPLYCGLLDQSGTPVGAPVRIAASTNARTPSPVAIGDGRYAVSFADDATGDWEIYVVTVDLAGEQTTTRVTEVAGTGWGTSMVWTGSSLGVAWYDDQAGDPEPDVFFTRISEGTVSPQTRLTDLGAQTAYTGELAWTDTAFVVGWRDIRDSGTWDVYLRRVGPDGVPAGEEVRVSDDTRLTGGPKLAWTGETLGLAYDDASSGDVWFARVTSGLAPIVDARIVLATPDPSEGSELVARGGDGFVLVWFEELAPGRAIYALSISEDGAPIGEARSIAGTPYFTGTEPSSPGLVWAGTHAAVVWSDGTEADAEIHFAEICP